MTSCTDQTVVISRTLKIPMSELHWKVSRSSGPGGQNVNKVNSRVQMSWRVSESAVLTPEQKTMILSACRRRISREGLLQISSERFRDQLKNRADVLQKLIELIQSALQPRTVRKPTKTPQRVIRRRLADKKHRSQVKSGRRSLGKDSSGAD